MNNDKAIREQIKSRVTGVGLIDKQTGGSGQYAKVEVAVQPMNDSNAPNHVINAVVGATIPTEFIPGVIDGINEGLSHGPLTGAPVTGVTVTILGGKSHPVDSNPRAFYEAGRLAVQAAVQKAEVVLLEPIAHLDVTVPAEFLGAVIGDINRRRGQVMDMTTAASGDEMVQATVPLAETFGYATDLRSLTQGRGSFSLQVQGYAEAPVSVLQNLQDNRL